MLKPKSNKDILPAGVLLQDMQMHRDNRGWLTEVYRQEWYQEYRAVQWNALFSKKSAVRGAHVHQQRVDYFVVPHGKAEIGLKDIRNNSPTENLACTVCLDANHVQIIVIPPGIIHAFYFLEDSILLSGFDRYWDVNDEFGCQWNDVDLEIPWQFSQGIVSKNDTQLPHYESLRKNFLLNFTDPSTNAVSG